MDVLDGLFGPNMSMLARFAVAFAVVFILVALLAWGLKRLGRGAAGGERRGRAPRLAVLEAIAVDQRRRLVLVRRDNMEHLLLLGGPSDVVVENAIQRPQRPAAPRTADGAPGSDGAPRSDVTSRPDIAPALKETPRVAPPAAPSAPMPRLAAQSAQTHAAGDNGDGTQKQLAEMAERLEMALRAPSQPRPARVAAQAPSNPAAVPKGTPEIAPPTAPLTARPIAAPPMVEPPMVEPPAVEPVSQSAVRAVAMAPTPELRPSAHDRIDHAGLDMNADNDDPHGAPDSALTAPARDDRPGKPKAPSLFGRLSRRSSS